MGNGKIKRKQDTVSRSEMIVETEIRAREIYMKERNKGINIGRQQQQLGKAQGQQLQVFDSMHA